MQLSCAVDTAAGTPETVHTRYPDLLGRLGIRKSVWTRTCTPCVRWFINRPVNGTEQYNARSQHANLHTLCYVRDVRVSAPGMLDRLSSLSSELHRYDVAILIQGERGNNFSQAWWCLGKRRTAVFQPHIHVVRDQLVNAVCHK